MAQDDDVPTTPAWLEEDDHFFNLFSDENYDPDTLQAMTGRDPKEMLSALFERELSPYEMIRILDRYPFLVLADSNVTELSEERWDKKALENGWILIDGGYFLLTGPGRYNFGDISAQVDSVAESASEGREVNEARNKNRRQGSLEWDTVKASQAMAKLAASRWQEVTVIDGSPRAQRCAWLALQQLNHPQKGYEPEFEDYLALSSIEAVYSDVDIVEEPTRPT